jgi:PAT family beta-lactamase induction signal transducer AmpG
MFGPMLTDRGVSRETIGLWIGTYGMATSIAGSVVGGLVAARTSLIRALVVAGILRSVPLGIQVAIAFRWVPLSLAPWSVGVAGMLTTCMFAFMMSRVDRTIGASHYTLLATVEVLGKTPPALLSGVLSQHLGYGPAFSLGLLVAMLWPLVAGPLSRRATAQDRPEPSDP